MVYAEGESTPAYKHNDYEKAQKEAQRLSETSGVECYVLMALSSHKYVKYEEHRFDVPIDFLNLPF